MSRKCKNGVLKMNELYQIYRCEICGTTIEVIHGGKGQLCCCGQGMRYYVENFFDRQRESHVPVVEKIPDGVRVRVGSVPHPMEKSHFIEWIEIIAEGKTARQFYRRDRRLKQYLILKIRQLL